MFTYNRCRTGGPPPPCVAFSFPALPRFAAVLLSQSWPPTLLPLREAASSSLCRVVRGLPFPHHCAFPCSTAAKCGFFLAWRRNCERFSSTAFAEPDLPSSSTMDRSQSRYGSRPFADAATVQFSLFPAPPQDAACFVARRDHLTRRPLSLFFSHGGGCPLLPLRSLSVFTK